MPNRTHLLGRLSFSSLTQFCFHRVFTIYFVSISSSVVLNCMPIPIASQTSQYQRDGLQSCHQCYLSCTFLTRGFISHSVKNLYRYLSTVASLWCKRPLPAHAFKFYNIVACNKDLFCCLCLGKW